MRRTDGPADRRTVDRRDFLAAVGALTLGGIVLDPAAARRSARPPVRLGIQLYTLRDLLQNDLEGTLAALAKMGYRNVELAGTYGRSAAEFAELLRRLGLRAPAGHVDLVAITDKLEQTIADARTLGHRYVICAWIPDERRTPGGYREVGALFNQAGERLRRAGLTLGYHNHSFEFEPLAGGTCGYDLLLESSDPRLVSMELDLFWIRKGGRDPLAYFDANPHRFRLVHVKDMAADGAMVDVGQGVMDWSRLLPAAHRAGVEYFFAEHDEARDPLAFARTSLDYLRRLKI